MPELNAVCSVRHVKDRSFSFEWLSKIVSARIHNPRWQRRRWGKSRELSSPVGVKIMSQVRVYDAGPKARTIFIRPATEICYFEYHTVS